MFNSLIGPLLELFFVLGALFALWRGGPAERWAAAVVIVNVAIGTVGNWLAPESDAILRLVNDGLAALLLLAVTLRYSSLWMGGMMLFFAAQFTLHSVYLVTGRLAAENLHAMINNIDWSGISWCLIIGTAVTWRRRLQPAAAA